MKKERDDIEKNNQKITNYSSIKYRNEKKKNQKKNEGAVAALHMHMCMYALFRSFEKKSHLFNDLNHEL